MTKAVHLSKEEFRATNVPGSFFVEASGDEGTHWLWCRCPCGCGVQSRLEVGLGFKPADSPSWKWNGSYELATLEPSVNYIDHWHGWLQNGEWHL